MIAVAVAPSAVATATTGAAWWATGQLATMKITPPISQEARLITRAVKRRSQRPATGQLGRGRVGVGQQSVAALPPEHRHQQPRADREPDEEQDARSTWRRSPG